MTLSAVPVACVLSLNLASGAMAGSMPSIWDRYYAPFLEAEGIQWIDPKVHGARGNSPLTCTTSTITIMTAGGDEVCIGQIGLRTRTEITSATKSLVAHSVERILTEEYYYAPDWSSSKLKLPINLRDLKQREQELKEQQNRSVKLFMQNPDCNDWLLKRIRPIVPDATGVYLEIDPTVTDWY